MTDRRGCNRGRNAVARRGAWRSTLRSGRTGWFGFLQSSESAHFQERLNALNSQASTQFWRRWTSEFPPKPSLSEDLRWLDDNLRLVRAVQRELQEASNPLRRVPHVRTPGKIVMPRVIAAAQDLLHSVEYRYSDHAFAAYVEAFQTVTRPQHARALSHRARSETGIAGRTRATCREGAGGRRSAATYQRVDHQSALI